MPDNKNKQGTSPLVVAAAIGVGALAAVGSYFLGREHAQQEHHGATAAPRPPRSSPPTVRSQEQTTVYKSATRKKKKGDDDEDEYEAHECGICFREFSQVKANNEEIHTTPCGHIYCHHCLSHSLRRDPRCPFCRSPVEPSQTLRVFLP